MPRGHVVSLASVGSAEKASESIPRGRGIDLAVPHQLPVVDVEDRIEEKTARSHAQPNKSSDPLIGLLYQRLELQKRRDLIEKLRAPLKPQIVMIPPTPQPAPVSPSHDNFKGEGRENRLEKTTRRMQELQMIMGMFSPYGMGGMYGMDGTLIFGLLGGVLLLTVAGGMAAYALSRRNRSPTRRIRLSLARSSSSSSSSNSSSSSSYSY